MRVVDHPPEIFTPVRQRVVDIVHGLGQRCKTLGYLFQPGSGSAVLRARGLPGRRLVLRLRHEPPRRHQCHRHDADADVQQVLERTSGRLDTECTGHAAARISRGCFHPPPGCQHGCCRRGTGKARRRKAEGRVCGAQGCPQHRAGGKGRLDLRLTAQVQLQCRAGNDPRLQLPQLHTAQRRCRRCPYQKHPGTRLFGRELPQTEPDGCSQQGICRTVEHQLRPFSAKGKAQRHSDQRAAARQRSRGQRSGSHPPCRHRSTQCAQHTDTAQRECAKPVQQHPQRRTCRAGGKAILCKAQHKAQTKGHQCTVQNGPAACKSHCHRRQPAGCRAQLCPPCQCRRTPVLPPCCYQTHPLCHKKFPAFRRGPVVLCPALSAYTVARGGGDF